MSLPFDGIPASAFGPPSGEPEEEPLAALPDGLCRLEVLCLRAIHHPLAFDELHRQLAGLRRQAPSAEIRLHLRSALPDLEPFRALPADTVERWADRQGRGVLAEGLRSLGERLPPASRIVLLAAPGLLWRRLESRGHRVVASLPLTFHTPGDRGEAGEVASAAFYAALARAAPRWVARPVLPEPIDLGNSTRFLVHQARFHVGDALWLTPLLAALRHRFPGSAATVVAPRAAEPVLAASRDVAELFFLEAGARPEERTALIEALELSRFSAALFAFARRPESRFLTGAAARAGVPWRLNLEYFDPFLDDREPAPPFTHEGWIFWGAEASPRALLHLLAPLGGLQGFPPDTRVRFPLSPEAHPRVRGLLSRAGLTGRSLAVLSPGGKSSVRWPAERFAELAGRLGRELGWGIVLSGSPAERGLLEGIARRVTAPLPAGPPLVFTEPLEDLAALLALTRLLVGNDSAPIHLAEALGTPTLYFAQREKLAHSHPRHPACRALYDDTANDLRRITTAQAMGAVLAELAILSPWRQRSS